MDGAVKDHEGRPNPPGCCAPRRRRWADEGETARPQVGTGFNLSPSELDRDDKNLTEVAPSGAYLT